MPKKKSSKQKAELTSKAKPLENEIQNESGTASTLCNSTSDTERSLRKIEAFAEIESILDEVSKEYPEMISDDDILIKGLESSGAGDRTKNEGVQKFPVPSVKMPRHVREKFIKEGANSSANLVNSKSSFLESEIGLKGRSLGSLGVPNEPKSKLKQFTNSTGSGRNVTNTSPRDLTASSELSERFLKRRDSSLEFKELFYRNQSDGRSTNKFDESMKEFTSASSTPRRLFSDRYYTATSSDFLQELSNSDRALTSEIDNFSSFDNHKLPEFINELQSNELPELQQTSKSLRAEAQLSKDDQILSSVRNEIIASDALDVNFLNLASEHGTFANEFIKDIQRKSETAFKSVPPKYSKDKKMNDVRKSRPGESVKGKNDVLTFRPIITTFQGSLKLVYSPPIWPHQQLLSPKLDKLSALRNLMLDDSELHTLRDLGSCLPNLITLSVLRCGLTSLDGAAALPNLENLFASNNQIESPAPIAFLSKIRYVDLSGNPISSLNGFKYLSICGYLRCMKLSDTETCQLKDFHVRLKELIPSLRDIYPKTSTLKFQNLDLEQELSTKDETVEYFDELRQRSFFESSDNNTNSSGHNVTNDDDDTLKTTESHLNYEDNIGKRLDKKLSQEMSTISEIMQLTDVEKRLREVYRPEKWNFQKMGTSRWAPQTIEEMDGLLEDIDNHKEPSSKHDPVTSTKKHSKKNPGSTKSSHSIDSIDSARLGISSSIDENNYISSSRSSLASPASTFGEVDKNKMRPLSATETDYSDYSISTTTTTTDSSNGTLLSVSRLGSEASSNEKKKDCTGYYSSEDDEET